MSGSGFQKPELPQARQRHSLSDTLQRKRGATLSRTRIDSPRLSSQGERFGSGRIGPAVSLFDLESVGSGMRRMNEECLADSDVCDPLCGSRGR